MATSKLQKEVGQMLDKTFPHLKVKENCRPEWLVSSSGTLLELDFYIEELSIAFEIQGEQHFGFVPFFHKDRSEFEKRKQYDAEKKDLCHGAGVKLIEICSSKDAVLVIGKIKEVPIPENELYKSRHQESLDIHSSLLDFSDAKNQNGVQAAAQQSKAIKQQVASKHHISYDNVEELYKWRKRALAWNRQGKSNAEDWIPNIKRNDIVKRIREGLMVAKSQDEIREAFYLLPVDPLPGYTQKSYRKKGNINVFHVTGRED